MTTRILRTKRKNSKKTLGLVARKRPQKRPAKQAPKPRQNPLIKGMHGRNGKPGVVSLATLKKHTTEEARTNGDIPPKPESPWLDGEVSESASPLTLAGGLLED